MQPDQATIALLAQLYRDFNARDAEAVLALMQPDVKWPKGFVGGYEHGRAAVRAYWADQWASINPHVEPTGFELLPDGRIAVTVHQVVRELDGTLLMDVLLHHVYQLRDGLIEHMEIQSI
ncbi:MAG: nuclear transport factor 2 family protein [Janthinobacterium lividum]